jgi:DNA repair exonuclease SbcCD nuclease subunit
MQFRQSDVCLISDLHFGVHQNSPLWHDIALKWVNWLVDELNQRNIRDIIICGDVFHNRNDIAVNTLNTVAKIFETLSPFNVVILVGNHDAYYRDRSDVNSISILNGWKNITVFVEPTKIQHNGVNLFFCPWGTTIDQIEQADVIFGHFEITTFKMNNFKVCDHGFHADELLAKAPNIITGHFHLREERVFKEGRVLYLGSPFELDWSDRDSVKGFYVFNLTGGDLTFVENKQSPKHIEVRLSDLIKQKSIGSIKDIVQGNIVRFVVDVKIDSDKVDIISKKLNSYQPVIFDIEHFCFTAADGEAAAVVESSVDISKTINDFVQTMELPNKDAVYAYVMELHQKAKQ